MARGPGRAGAGRVSHHGGSAQRPMAGERAWVGVALPTLLLSTRGPSGALLAWIQQPEWVPYLGRSGALSGPRLPQGRVRGGIVHGPGLALSLWCPPDFQGVGLSPKTARRCPALPWPHGTLCL